MPTRKNSVLVVDDEIRILRMVQHILEMEGYRVITARNGITALNVFDEETPDLAIIDIMMPVMDGYTLCQRIREFSHIPVIMITAKDSEDDKISGLDKGADDYITKPFSARELMARIRAVLRRSKLYETPSDSSFQLCDLNIDFARHRVKLGDNELHLTATEYKILSYLASNADRVVLPDQILRMVWGDECLGEVHMLQVNIARIRNKLNDDAKHPRYILTKPGIGYMMPKTSPLNC